MNTRTVRADLLTIPPEIVGKAEACIFELEAALASIEAGKPEALEAARGAMQGAVDLLCDLDRVAE